MMRISDSDVAKKRVRSGGIGARWSTVVLGLLLVGLFPLAAAAHQQLLRATPGKGDHLSAAPSQLRLVFNEPVEIAVSRVRLTGPLGDIALAELMLDADSSTVLVAGIAGTLVAGTYTVTWQVVGSDGHPVRGEYTFTIAPGATGLGEAVAGPAAPGQEPPPAEHHPAATFPSGPGFDAESPLYAAVRWLTFIGLLGIIGVVAFRLLVLQLVTRRRDPVSEDMVSRAASGAIVAGVAAVVVLVVALLLRLYAQSWALHGASAALDPTLLRTMLSRTLWGWGWLLQLAGTVVGLVGLALARGDRLRGWTVAAAGALILAFTPALSGHAAAASGLAALAILADGLHVLGAGGWLGSLFIVVAIGIPAALRGPEMERGRAVAALINAFSPTALFFAGMVVATGVFAAWLQLGSVPALWQSTYGRTLLIKVAVLSLVFGTGAYNWLKVRPALGNEAAAGRLRRSATLELAVGVIVLAVTAVLVATATPANEAEHADTTTATTSIRASP